MQKHYKILLGGSPCTYWSISQSSDKRETTASGIGWELFKNFLIAKEKFKPDYFLYENNKSMAKPIRNQIDIEFNHTYAENMNWELISSVEEDKGHTKRWLWRNKTTGKTECITRILINSALVSAQNRQRYYWTNIPNVQQPTDRGILLKDILESGIDLTQSAQGGGLGAKTGLYAVPYEYIDYTPRKNSHIVINENAIRCAQDKNNASVAESFINFSDVKIGTITTAHIPKCIESADKHQKAQPIYQVKDGQITIKDKQYPIKLVDGYYIIRKLTVKECMRLQTIPDWYKMPCSNSQNYKMIGNGWTVEVIKHILSYIPDIANCTVEVLSMYDGMSCGQITLTELGCKIHRYVSYEIDKYAIQTTQANFPNTEQRGDAFQLRQENWKY